MAKQYVVNSVVKGKNKRNVFPTFEEAVQFSIGLPGFVNVIEEEVEETTTEKK